MGLGFLNYGLFGPGIASFDRTFHLMGVIGTLFFALIIGFFVVVIVREIAQWNKNNHSPKLTVSATVVTKQTDVSHHHHHGSTGMRHTTHSTTYYVTFQVESGDRMELHVAGREFGMLTEGDQGKLTFQGTRYLGFERI